MADDELSAPLGKSAKKEQQRFRLPIRIPHVIAGLLGLFVLACAAWALMVDDPLGGEPIAVVATGFDPPKSGLTLPTVVSAQGPRGYDGPAAPASKQAPAPTSAQPAGAPLPAANPNTKTVTIIDGSTGKRQEVPISAVARRPRAARAAPARNLAPRRHPAYRARRRAAGRALRPRGGPAAGQEGRSADRDRHRRTGRQRQRHPASDGKASWAGDLRASRPTAPTSRAW